MESKISLKQHFKNLRDEDRRNLIRVLVEAKKEGLDFYLTGSSAHSEDYHDIDVVVSKGKFGEKSLDRVIGKLLIGFPLQIKKVTQAKEVSYVNHEVNKRYEVKLGETNLDICYSNASASKFFY